MVLAFQKIVVVQPSGILIEQQVNICRRYLSVLLTAIFSF